MTEPTSAALRRRQRELEAELQSRRTTSELQADMVRGGGRNAEPASHGDLTTSQLQARVALGEADDEDGDKGYDPDELPSRPAVRAPRQQMPSDGYIWKRGS